MVMRANDNDDGLGGHIATFSSAATLYDVGFNYFSAQRRRTTRRFNLFPKVTVRPVCTRALTLKAEFQKSSWIISAVK